MSKVRSGAAEQLIEDINKVCDKYKDDWIAYDDQLKSYRQHYMWGVFPELPIAPDKEVYIKQLLNLGVSRDSAEKYLENSKRGKKKK